MNHIISAVWPLTRRDLLIMGLNQSKLPSPAGGIQIGSLMCTLPPACNYTFKSAVDEGQKAIINHEVQLHQLQKMQESQSIINQTTEIRLTAHENRIIQLIFVEECALTVKRT